MASMTKHKSNAPDGQREAILELVSAVGEVLDALDTYLTRLGDDGGVCARIMRKSHFGLFEPRVSALNALWRRHEPRIHDATARRAFLTAGLGALLSPLEHLNDSHAEQWDSTVREMHRNALRLDRALRRAGGAPARDLGVEQFVVPNFSVGERLGGGAFGEVFVAQEQSPLALRRAVKILRPMPFFDSEDATARFLREAEALTKLSHPNVIAYFTSGWTEGAERLLFVVMGLVEGKPLREARSTMTVGARVAALAAILDGLEYAHSCGAFHRDVKPSNIMIRESDNEPVLVDFGLVSFADLDSELTNGTIGSPGYVPPEVLADPRKSRGPGHDIYSAAVTLYETITGCRPDPSDYTPIVSHVAEAEGLDPIIQKGLARATERFDRASEFAEALRAWLRGEEPVLDSTDLSRIQSVPLRDALMDANQAIAHGNLIGALIFTAAVYEAMRICWARAARRAGGVNLRGKEGYLPARLSTPAMSVFQDMRGYFQEPSLANDKYGPPSLFSMGFTRTEQSVIRSQVELAEECIRRKHEWPLDDVELDQEQLIAVLGAIAERLMQLETDDPHVFAATDETV